MIIDVNEKSDKKSSEKSVTKIDNRIKIGRLRKGTDKKTTSLMISEPARKGNSLILGSKLSGKSGYMLPYLARQDIERKDAGCTFVVSQKDLAYTLFAIAKLNTKKKVHIIKPSCDLGVANTLLRDTTVYKHNRLNNIINFKEVIKKKEIVIIDMENSRYHQDAIRAVAKLLIQLQVDMQDVVSTIKRDHFVYIDDAQNYLPFIDTLLNYGDDYNISTTLFMQGRNQFQMYGEDYSSLIVNNVRNYILMNNINFEDVQYFAPFFNMTIYEFLQRPAGTFSAIIGDAQGSTKLVATCEVLRISDEDMKKIEERAKKERKKLVKTSNTDERNTVLGNTERRGFRALISEEIEKENKSMSIEKSINEKTQFNELLKIQEPTKNTEEEEIIPNLNKTLNDSVDISQEIEVGYGDDTFGDELPDLGFDDDETYTSDEVQLEEPEFAQGFDLESIKEPIETPMEDIELDPMEVPVVEPFVTQNDDEIVLATKEPLAYRMANSRIGKRRSFAPKRRSEIEIDSVEDFYSSVLGDKLGGR